MISTANRRTFGRVFAPLTLAALGFITLTSFAKADILVTAGADKKIKIWNPADGKLIKEIEASDGTVNSVLVSPDGKTILTAGSDKKVKLWNAADGKLIKEIAAHDSAVNALSFMPDGKMVASGGDDKKVKIWDLTTGKLTSTIENEEKVTTIYAIPSMTVTGGGDGTVKIWGDEGNLLFPITTNHTGGLKAVGFNSQEECLYTGGGDGALKFWSQGSNGEFDKKAGGTINAVLSTPDGKTVVTGSADGKVNLWDAAAHTWKATVDAGQKGGVTSLAISPDGKLIFTGGADKSVKVWTSDGKPIKTVENAQGGAVTVIVYHADKKAAEVKPEPKKSE